jgi:hypothetical protein
MGMGGQGDNSIQNSKFKIQNSKFKIQNSKFKIQNSKFKIQNFPTPDSRLRGSDGEVSSPSTRFPTP